MVLSRLKRKVDDRMEATTTAHFQPWTSLGDGTFSGGVLLPSEVAISISVAGELALHEVSLSLAVKAGSGRSMAQAGKIMGLKVSSHRCRSEKTMSSVVDVESSFVER